MKILVSKCLLGFNCRYKGDNCKSDKVLQLQEKGYEIVGICPECDGGLPTPRPAGEITQGRVLTKDGKDITAEYKKGAEHALNLAKEQNIKKAVLKSKSPSCGYGIIYDGTFSGNLIKGNGITAQLLSENGVEIIPDTEVNKL